MTALILRRPKSWLPTFAPWRLLRPIRLEGQFSPGQRMQFEGAGDTEIHSGGVVGGDISLTYVDTYLDTSAQTTYSFTSVDCGAGGHVIALVGDGNDTRSISSVTINGVSATIHVQTDQSNQAQCGIASAEGVGGGTGKTVTVVLSGATDGCTLHIYTMANYSSATPHHTAHHDGGNAVSSLSIPVNTPSGGVAIGISIAKSGPSDNDFSGVLAIANGAVEDYDTVSFDGGHCRCVRSRTGLSLETGAACSATWDVGSRVGACIATWI